MFGFPQGFSLLRSKGRSLPLSSQTSAVRPPPPPPSAKQRGWCGVGRSSVSRPPASIASVWRVGRSRLASEQITRFEHRPIGQVRLVSTFVGRETAGSNRSIVRRAPRIMALPPEAPAELAVLAAQGAQIAAAMTRLRPSSWPARREAEILPCPATDFNAVGLLYFPSFAALTERADFASGGAFDRLLTSRDVVYTGNVEPGEAVDIAFRDRPTSHVAHIASVDGRPLALLRTRYLHL